MPRVDYVHRILTILRVLKEETNREHGFSAREIARILQERYDLPIDPRSVRSIIAELIEGGFPIADKPKYHYAGVFSVGEAEYLLQAVRFGSGLTQKQRDDLANKITAIAANLPEKAESVPCQWRKPSNPEMLETLETIRRAISAGRRISFEYASYDLTGALIKKPSRSGTSEAKQYTASPYRIIFANGRYYLLAAVNDHKAISHYRIDRMLSVRRRRALARPCPETIDSGAYIVERPYMYIGPVYSYKLHITVSMMNDVCDRFGSGIIIDTVSGDTADVIVRSDARSMQIWVDRYGGSATVIPE